MDLWSITSEEREDASKEHVLGLQEVTSPDIIAVIGNDGGPRLGVLDSLLLRSELA